MEDLTQAADLFFLINDSTDGADGWVSLEVSPLLCASDSADVRAAEAVELFCYQMKKWIGSFSSALGGLDMLVFAGGIGENQEKIGFRPRGALR